MAPKSYLQGARTNQTSQILYIIWLILHDIVCKYLSYAVYCMYTVYGRAMIKSWKHKGLKKFYQTGNTAGIQPKHRKNIKEILFQLVQVI